MERYHVWTSIIIRYDMNGYDKDEEVEIQQLYKNLGACDSINELDYSKPIIKVSGFEVTGLENYHDSDGDWDEINLWETLNSVHYNNEFENEGSTKLNMKNKIIAPQ